jgi:hypothetical protein
MRRRYVIAIAIAIALGMAGPRDAGWPYGIPAMLLALYVLVDVDRRGAWR